MIRLSALTPKKAIGETAGRMMKLQETCFRLYSSIFPDVW
eukprot:SAG22_NODE_5434_length_1014_cov_1.245902_1_plen_39_part_10